MQHDNYQDQEWWSRQSLTTTAKKEEKEIDNQHEDHDQEGHD